MITFIYNIVFLISVLCAVMYVYMWHKHYDVNFTMIFTLIPIACVGYMLLAHSTTVEEALVATKIAYIGGSFLELFMLYSIFNLCHIPIKKWIRTGLFVINALVYAATLTAGYNTVFYKSATLTRTRFGVKLIKEYGVMHTIFYVVIVVYFVIGMVAMGYSWYKKTVSRRVIAMLVIPNVISFATFFLGKYVWGEADVVPVAYVIAEGVYLLIAYRVNLYDVADTVIDSVIQEDGVGFISCDFNCRYLGSNEMARKIIPALSSKAVDEPLEYNPTERRIRHYIESFKSDNNDNSYVYVVHGDKGDPDDERIYNVAVGYLYDGNRKRGYLITFTDDTANRKYISLIDKYNDDLKEEVEEKTKHIVEMHDNLVMSLAVMVESRDNSTGGHIKRTSEGVRILIDEINRSGVYSLTPKFCNDVIKAAPMHDLGKIAVDDAILRKPGRFTDEEYEQMKRHAAEGAKVIHEILLNTDDEEFKVVAENVAHYHHERFDGSGYPDGLVGENIPVEARIMAVADVYDALVSKRVYKEAYDFAKADEIIMSGMGTQFDPALKAVYENAREKLEEYYKNIQ